MDEMKLSSTIPIIISLGILISIIFVRSRDLSIPLWYGR